MFCIIPPKGRVKKEGATNLLPLLESSSTLSASLLLRLALLEKGLGNEDVVLGRDGPTR
jgi:hypothetical protein